MYEFAIDDDLEWQLGYLHEEEEKITRDMDNKEEKKQRQASGRQNLGKTR